MRIKKGVILAGLQLQMNPVFIEPEKVWEKYGQEVVFTGGLDGKHSAASLHYSGYAVDLRTRYFPKDKHQTIASELQTALGFDFQVIVHKTHIHVEYEAGKQFIGRG